MLNAKDVDGWTSLHHAAYFGNKEIVELLLSREANLNAKEYRWKDSASRSYDSIERSCQ